MQGQQNSSVEISVVRGNRRKRQVRKKKSEVPIGYSYPKKEKKITGTNILLGKPIELVL